MPTIEGEDVNIITFSFEPTRVEEVIIGSDFIGSGKEGDPYRRLNWVSTLDGLRLMSQDTWAEREEG